MVRPHDHGRRVVRVQQPRVQRRHALGAGDAGTAHGQRGDGGRTRVLTARATGWTRRCTRTPGCCKAPGLTAAPMRTACAADRPDRFLLILELGIGGYASDGRHRENLDALHSLDINPAHLLATMPANARRDLAQAMRAGRCQRRHGRSHPATRRRVTCPPDSPLGRRCARGARPARASCSRRANTRGAGMAVAFARSRRGGRGRHRVRPGTARPATSACRTRRRDRGGGPRARRGSLRAAGLFLALVATSGGASGRTCAWARRRSRPRATPPPARFGAPRWVSSAVRPLTRTRSARLTFWHRVEGGGRSEHRCPHAGAYRAVPGSERGSNRPSPSPPRRARTRPVLRRLHRRFPRGNSATVRRGRHRRPCGEPAQRDEIDFSRAAPGFTRREVRGAPTPDELGVTPVCRPARGRRYCAPRPVRRRCRLLAGGIFRFATLPCSSTPPTPPPPPPATGAAGSFELAPRNSDPATPDSNDPRLGGTDRAARPPLLAGSGRRGCGQFHSVVGSFTASLARSFAQRPLTSWMLAGSR